MFSKGLTLKLILVGLLYEFKADSKLIQLMMCLQIGVLNNNSNVFRHSVTIESTSNNDIYALFNRLESF